jgi:hypothetical protein
VLIDDGDDCVSYAHNREDTELDVGAATGSAYGEDMLTVAGDGTDRS